MNDSLFDELDKFFEDFSDPDLSSSFLDVTVRFYNAPLMLNITIHITDQLISVTEFDDDPRTQSVTTTYPAIQASYRDRIVYELCRDAKGRGYVRVP